MVVKFSRAQRRHDRKRLKKKRQFHWGYGYKRTWYLKPPEDIRGNTIDYMSPKIAGMVITTPHPCSCAMCGNPRRTLAGDLGELSIQEIRALDDFHDQLDELFLP